MESENRTRESTRWIWNANDREAAKWLGTVAVGVGSAFAAVAVPRARWPLMALSAGAGALATARLRRQPIVAVYAGSFVISAFVRNRPFLDANEHFPNHARLEDPAFVYALQRELAALLARTHGGKDIRWTKDSFGGQNARIGGEVRVDARGRPRGWHIYHVKLGDEFTAHARRDFPTLVAQLAEMKEVRACSISILDERSEIPEHIGYFKGILRYMLALKVPSEPHRAKLRVDGESYSWREGEGVLWDDTFRHSVRNDSDESRIVLYMDVLRPLPKPLALIRDALAGLMVRSPVVRDELRQSELRPRRVSEAEEATTAVD